MGMGANPFVGASRQRYRHAQPVAEINVTPMVDVMLVLLVIFMVTAPLLTSTVDVDLPSTQAGQSRAADDPVTVTVNGQSQIFIGDTQIEPNELVTRLRAIGENRRDLRIYVRGDRQLAYGRIMEVMGIITAAGYERVALVVEAAASGGAVTIQAPNIGSGPGTQPAAPPAAPAAPPATQAPRPQGSTQGAPRPAAPTPAPPRAQQPAQR
jgi:biopolymer transport protein TolR